MVTVTNTRLDPQRCPSSLLAKRREEIEFRTPFTLPETGVLPYCGWTDGVHPSLGKGGEGLSRSRREGLRWSTGEGVKRFLRRGRWRGSFSRAKGFCRGTRDSLFADAALENPSPRPGFVVDTHRRLEVDRHGWRRDSKFLFNRFHKKHEYPKKREYLLPRVQNLIPKRAWQLPSFHPLVSMVGYALRHSTKRHTIEWFQCVDPPFPPVSIAFTTLTPYPWKSNKDVPR